jgi:hypothetical protein
MLFFLLPLYLLRLHEFIISIITITKELLYGFILRSVSIASCLLSTNEAGSRFFFSPWVATLVLQGHRSCLTCPKLRQEASRLGNFPTCVLVVSSCSKL